MNIQMFSAIGVVVWLSLGGAMANAITEEVVEAAGDTGHKGVEFDRAMFRMVEIDAPEVLDAAIRISPVEGRGYFVLGNLFCYGDGSGEGAECFVNVLGQEEKVTNAKKVFRALEKIEPRKSVRQAFSSVFLGRIAPRNGGGRTAKVVEIVAGLHIPAEGILRAAQSIRPKVDSNYNIDGILKCDRVHLEPLEGNNPREPILVCDVEIADSRARIENPDRLIGVIGSYLGSSNFSGNGRFQAASVSLEVPPYSTVESAELILYRER